MAEFVRAVAGIIVGPGIDGRLLVAPLGEVDPLRTDGVVCRAREGKGSALGRVNGASVF
jgi:hypothetical protein